MRIPLRSMRATPPTTLHGRTIEAVAQYIKEKDVKNIVVMVNSPTAHDRKPAG